MLLLLGCIHKQRNLLLISCLLIAFSWNSYSQEIDKLMYKADVYYASQDYNKALKYYLKALDIDNYSTEANIQCGRCYDRLDRYMEAERFYSNVFKIPDSVDPILFLEYGELQLKLGHPDLARSYFVSYNNLIEKNDLRALRYIKSIEDIDKYYLDSSYINVSRLEINSPWDEYNPILYGSKLYFESNRAFADNSPSFRSIYFFDFQKYGNNKVIELKGNGASKYLGTGFCIGQFNSELIQSIKSVDPSNPKHILVISTLVDDGTQKSEPSALPINADNYDVLFPTITSNGDKIIFASESPSGYGGLDLYVSFRNSDGYSTPQPLNELINTLADDSYPYLANDSILFFASKGQGGLGGYDIFYVNLNLPASIPVNLGYPINSRFDDYGLTLAEGGLAGFFVSHRASIGTRSDIYNFQVTQIRALGVVTDGQTAENLKNVEIEITRKGKPTSQFVLADNGNFYVNVEPGDEFGLFVRKENYLEKEYHVSTKGLGQIGLFEESIGDFSILKKIDTILRITPEKEKLALKTKDDNKVLGTVKTVLPIKKPNALEIEDSLKFRVQIAASRVPLSKLTLKAKYKGNKKIFKYEEDGWYKYAIGDFGSYFDAKALLKRCGVRDAFIAAYANNKKVDLMYAIRVANSVYARNQSDLKEKRSNMEGEKNIILYYPFDIFKIIDAEKDKIDAILNLILSDSSFKIEIKGYTDLHGSIDYNYGLGAVRAKYVRDYLIKHGIDPNRIITESYGETKLKKHCHDNCTPADHAVNRRTEINIYKDIY